jgi:hypothetical protein
VRRRIHIHPGNLPFGAFAQQDRQSLFPDETPPSPQNGSLIYSHLRFISGQRRPVLLSHLPEELRGVRRSYEDQKSEKPLPSCSGPAAVPHTTLYGLVRASTAYYGHVWKKTLPSGCMPLPYRFVSSPCAPWLRGEFSLRTAHATTCTNLHLLAPSCGKKNCANQSPLGLSKSRALRPRFKLSVLPKLWAVNPIAGEMCQSRIARNRMIVTFGPFGQSHALIFTKLPL